MALTLLDLINRAVLEELARSIWHCSGIPVKVIDPQGHILAASGRQDLCFLFHRRHPVTLKRCIESDTEIGEQTRIKAAEGTRLESLCRNGLNHIGLPIVVAGEHLATLFLFQFLYDPPDEEAFRQRARTLGFDEGEYLAALRKIPVFDRARVKEVVSFCEVMVRMASEMGTREAKLLESRDRLRESEERFRNVIDSTPLGVHLYQLVADELILTGANPAADAILGIEHVPLFGRTIEEAFPPLGATEIPERYREVCRGGRWKALEVPYHDGIKGTFEVHAFPTGTGRMAVLFADISERKKREAELLYRERFEALIAGISTRFMEVGPAGLDQTIEAALFELVEFAGVDRAYLFCLSVDGERMSNTHEACSAGVLCQRNRLQELPVSDFPWIIARLKAGKIVHVPRVADLPPEAAREKDHFVAQQIQSMLSVPVVTNGHLVGVVGFDAVRCEKVWDRRDIVLLRTFADLLGSALERRRAVEVLEYRAQLEHLIATLSTRMLNLDAEAIDTAIEAALGEIGAFVGVDRCYVFQFSTDGQRLSNTHEWCGAGILPARERLQDVSVTALPWFLQRILRREPLLVSDVEELGPEARLEKEEYEQQQIRSLLCLPMMIEDRVIGVVGFDSVRRRKRWSHDLVLLLRLVGEFFAGALERRRRDRELRQTQERIAAILRSLKAGLVGVDQEGRIILINRPAAEILGLDAAGARGRPLAEMHVEQALQKQIASVLAGENPESVEWTVPSRDKGPARTVRARTDAVRSDERKRRGAITMLQDVTAEREIDRIKSEFISTAAHELRTPLASVLGYAELLLNQETFGTFSFQEEREFLEEIYKKAESLNELISDLLDLSRIESGQLVRLSLSPTSPVSLIEEVVEDFRRRTPERRFELSLPPDLPEISVDGGKIRQVLENLLGNAVKFSASGSRVNVEAALLPDRIEVAVADEGVGMSPEVLARIFEKFYRGTVGHSIAGLGLGMPIVKNILEAHGGTIRVESTEGVGTRVTFTLPLSGNLSAKPTSPPPFSDSEP